MTNEARHQQMQRIAALLMSARTAIEEGLRLLGELRAGEMEQPPQADPDRPAMFGRKPRPGGRTPADGAENTTARG